MSIRIKLHLQDKKYGATETWYVVGTDTLKPRDCELRASQLMTARQGILPGGVELHECVISDDNSARDGLSIYSSQVDNTTRHGLADNPYSGILSRYNSNGDYTMSRILAFQSDRMILDQAFNPSTDWQNDWLNYMSVLTNGFGWKALAKNADGGVVAQITNVAVDNSGLMTVTAAGHGLTPGKKVRLSKIHKIGDTDPNGVFIVKSVTGDSFNVVLPSAPGSFIYVGGGFTQLQKYVIVPCTGGDWYGPKSRKRGGSLGSPRGRRRTH